MTVPAVGINFTPLSHLGPFDPPWMKAIAQQVERLGFDALWCGDHIIMHNGILDAMTVLATFGAVTERLKVGTGDANPPRPRLRGGEGAHGVPCACAATATACSTRIIAHSRGKPRDRKVAAIAAQRIERQRRAFRSR